LVEYLCRGLFGYRHVGIFKVVEAWGQGSRERDSSRCLIPVDGDHGPAQPTTGSRSDGPRARGKVYRTPNPNRLPRRS
jgi:hypothetical protein